jgi:zinc finger HIT domain-containing protein 1
MEQKPGKFLMPPKRKSERRKTSALTSPEVEYVKLIADHRVDQLERDQAGGVFDTGDVAEDVLGELSDSDAESSKKKRPKTSQVKQAPVKRRGAHRERRSLDELLADEVSKKGDTFISILVKPSKYPAPHLCSVCLATSKYKCIRCGLRYCSTPCQKMHAETKCLKFST